MFLKLGLQSVNLEVARDVTEAAVDDLFGDLDEGVLAQARPEGYYPLLEVLSDAIQQSLRSHDQAETVDKEYIEALSDGIALGFAILADVADAQSRQAVDI